MYHTTGFAEDEIIDLCALVYANEENCYIDPWPPSLGLYKSVVIALTYMRRNRVQQEVAETYKTSQPTISRANSRITSRLAIVLAPFVPAAEDLDPDTQYIYDGTLLPCWSWREHRELYSGKRKTTGKNVQVACNLYGELAWISDPVDGSRHDAHCIDESSVLAAFPDRSQIGDKGYAGKRMITPIRKPECRDLLDWEKEFNAQVNKIRYMIEQVIANFKTWRIMHTDYRRPLDTFDTTISAVVELHFYRMGWISLIVRHVDNVRVQGIKAGVDLLGREEAGPLHVDLPELRIPRIPEVSYGPGEVKSGELAHEVPLRLGHARHRESHRDGDRRPRGERQVSTDAVAADLGGAVGCAAAGECAVSGARATELDVEEALLADAITQRHLRGSAGRCRGICCSTT